MCSCDQLRKLVTKVRPVGRMSLEPWYILYLCIPFFVPGTFKLYEKPPDVETLTEEEKSEENAEKGKEKSYKRKRSIDGRSSEDNDDPGPSSTFKPKQRTPAKKPSFCKSLNYSRS